MDDRCAPRHAPGEGWGEETVEKPTATLGSRTAMRTSRRAFIKGVIASGSSVAAMSYMFRTGLGSTPALAAPGAVERLITLKVNGQLRRVDVLPNETLAMTLRYKLGLPGTKLGCDRGECGACTTMLDGITHYSCTTLTHSAQAMCSDGIAASWLACATIGEPHEANVRPRDTVSTNGAPASSRGGATG